MTGVNRSVQTETRPTATSSNINPTRPGLELGVWQLSNVRHGTACKTGQRLCIRINIEICALLGHNAAGSGNFLPTFQDSISVPA
jgi:hypothetical protein